MHPHEKLPPKPPRRRQAARWHIGEKDVVSIHGIPHRCIKNDDAGYVFVRVGDPKAEPIPISREEFNDLHDLQSFDFDADGLDADKALTRLQARSRSLMDLPEDKREYIKLQVRVCQKFLKMKAEGRASLYGPGLKYALNVIQREIDEERRRKRGGRNSRSSDGVVGPDQFRKVWLPRYLNGGALGLCDRYHNCGNRYTPLTAEEYAILLKYTWRYLSPERPSIAFLWGEMEKEIFAENAKRPKSQPQLRVPDDDRLRIEIGKLPKFDVEAARNGEEHARNKYRPVTGGVPDLVRPMQRVEMDDWTTHLHVLLIEAGFWEWVSPELKAKADTTRAVLSAAICCTTRVIPAIGLSLKAEGANTRALLRMMLSDKTKLAQWVGCETPYEYRGTPLEVAVDEGSAFVNDDSQFICEDLGIAFKSPQGEMPTQRGKIERWFRTLEIRSLLRFSGRAFSNPKVRGKYESEVRACVTLEELAALIVRFVVDQYHNLPHAGLWGETPRACWLRLSKRLPPRCPPGRARIRRAFGQDFTATVQASGIEIFGNWYQSREVQEVFETEGPVEVVVRADSEDLGAISLRRPNGWATVAGPDIMDGVSVEVWENALASTRWETRDIANLSKPVVHRAIGFAQKADEETRKRLTILYREKTPQQFEDARKRMSSSVRYRQERTGPAAPSDIFAGSTAVAGDGVRSRAASSEPRKSDPARKKSKSNGTAARTRKSKSPRSARTPPASEPPTGSGRTRKSSAWTFKGK